MEIAIKSETDSRVIVYPLIKALYNYGTIAIYTSNKWMTRLIENQLEGGFNNVRVVVSPEGDLDFCKETDDYYRNKYDFLIFDNIGAIDYDLLIAVVTNRISEDYVGDLIFLATDPKTHILKFGTPAAKPKAEKPAKKQKGEASAEEQSADDSEEFNKWNQEKTDEEVLKEMLESRESKWIKFPSFDSIENMEGRHNMMIPDDTFTKEVYRLFKDYINVDERMFMKGVRVKDEGGSDISGTDVW